MEGLFCHIKMDEIEKRAIKMITVTAIFHIRNSCKRDKENFENKSFSRRDPQSFESIDQSNTFQAILENSLVATNNITSIPTATNVNVASALSTRQVGQLLSRLKPNVTVHSVLPVNDNNGGADHNGNQI